MGNLTEPMIEKRRLLKQTAHLCNMSGLNVRKAKHRQTEQNNLYKKVHRCRHFVCWEEHSEIAVLHTGFSYNNTLLSDAAGHHIQLTHCDTFVQIKNILRR